MKEINWTDQESEKLARMYPYLSNQDLSKIYFGRILSCNEIVHHKNEVKTDNRIENLEIMTNAEHTILHHTGKKRTDETKNKISEKRRERGEGLSTR